ncbi:hypothetical protein [Candidatus Leptofilum sp.]|uniref:hypothetical protein n=1 Tax=Candidatus Leptofilum sp. TaxID=3241576 RepID=UPI003B59B800
MLSKENYDNNYDDINEDNEDIPLSRWLGYGLAILLMLLLGILIGSCFGPERVVEVTRMIPGDVTEVPVTVVVYDEIEVTRIVSEVGVTEVPVTRIVNETVEVTRIVPEEVVTEVPVTRIVTETEQIVVTKIIPVPPEVTVTPGSGRGCTRFDLEIGRNQVDGTPEDGIYMMQEPSGHQLATWTAKQGWLDSGWLRNLPLSRSEVQVQVFFYPTVGGGPIPLEILNPAPGTTNGWLANDVCHAIEIQFPE